MEKRAVLYYIFSGIQALIPLGTSNPKITVFVGRKVIPTMGFDCKNLTLMSVKCLSMGSSCS